MSLPLSQIKVLDLSRILAGPLCTMILADLGAEVIKVEPPQGDDTRSWGPPFQGDLSAYFATINRNKKSLVLDLKQEGERKILKQLITRCDILVENYLPASAERLGLDKASIQKLNPNIVHCSITGYGHQSAWKNIPGYDFVIQGLSGLMGITGEPDGAPMKVGVALTDVITGLYAAVGILAELFARKNPGAQPAKHLDVSLLQSALASLVNVGQAHLMTGGEAKRYGNAHPQIVPYQTFATKDGYLVIAVGNDEQFRRFCEILGRQSWADEPRFRTNPDRVAHRLELEDLINEVMTGKTNQQWSQLLEGRNVPFGAVQTVREAFHLAQSLYPDACVTDPTGLKYPRSPVVRDGQPQPTPRHPPKLNQDRQEILRRFKIDSSS